MTEKKITQAQKRREALKVAVANAERTASTAAERVSAAEQSLRDAIRAGKPYAEQTSEVLAAREVKAAADEAAKSAREELAAAEAEAAELEAKERQKIASEAAEAARTLAREETAKVEQAAAELVAAIAEESKAHDSLAVKAREAKEGVGAGRSPLYALDEALRFRSFWASRVAAGL